MMERKHGYGRRKANALGPGRNIGERQIRAGQNAERVEMVLADPSGMKSELVREDRFVDNIVDILVGAAAVVRIVVVAQREIAEIHWFPPLGGPPQRARPFRSLSPNFAYLSRLPEAAVTVV